MLVIAFGVTGLLIKKQDKKLRGQLSVLPEVCYVYNSVRIPNIYSTTDTHRTVVAFDMPTQPATTIKFFTMLSVYHY